MHAGRIPTWLFPVLPFVGCCVVHEVMLWLNCVSGATNQLRSVRYRDGNNPITKVKNQKKKKKRNKDNVEEYCRRQRKSIM